MAAAIGGERPDAAAAGASDGGTSRFWFPSVTAWYAELNKKHAVTVILLCYVNLINYMDRSNVAGMIDFIKKDSDFKPGEHDLSDKKMGLLQTAFVITYMLFAPLFGYLGDRYNRQLILGVGIGFWAASTLIGSFMRNFWWFLFFRALVGIGEASYSTIAPAMISDLFKADSRSRVLALFYFAIPVGTGLGYMVGSGIASAAIAHTGDAADWRWGLRLTPFMGFLAILLIVFVFKDPPRGEAEGARLQPGHPTADLKALVKNKSYGLSVIAFTCVTFSAGALMWWGPSFAFNGARAACGNKGGCEDITLSSISYRFGIVMTMAGLLGVPLGSYVAQMLRHKMPNADPIVCATTLLASCPVLFFGFIAARYSTAWCYGLTFLAGLLLNCNWSIVSDITLYIVLPTRRSLASATQILVSHALGDAISPYMIGAIADAIRPVLDPGSHDIVVEVDDASGSVGGGIGTFIPRPVTGTNIMANKTAEEYDIEFRSLQYALFACCFFQVFGALFFYIMSWHIIDDKQTADRAIAEFGDRMIIGDAGDVSDDQQPIIRNMYADDPYVVSAAPASASGGGARNRVA